MKFRDGCATRWLGTAQLLETNLILEPVVRIVYNNLDKTDAEDVIASIKEDWEEAGADGDIDYEDFIPILERDYTDIVPSNDQYALAAEIEGILGPLNFVMKKMQTGGLLCHVVVALCEILRVNYGHGSHGLVNWRIPDRAKQFVGRKGRTWSFKATDDLSTGAKCFLNIMKHELQASAFFCVLYLYMPMPLPEFFPAHLTCSLCHVLQRRIFDIPYPDSLLMGVKLNPFTTPERVFGKGEDAEILIARADDVYRSCLMRAMIGIIKRQAKDERRNAKQVSFSGKCTHPYFLYKCSHSYHFYHDHQPCSLCVSYTCRWRRRFCRRHTPESPKSDSIVITRQ